MTFEDLTSDDFFIHMEPHRIPEWTEGLSYYEQSAEALIFWENELRKCREGVTIDGYHIHGWMYFHINFFKTPVPTLINAETGEQKDIIKTPPLDDNFLYVIETYKRASKEAKGMAMFGCRGFAKSTDLASLSHWSTITKPDGFTAINGGDADDLTAITDLVRQSMENTIEPLRTPTKEKDWKDNVRFSLVEKGTNFEYSHSSIRVKNANKGKESASEKGAGGNASCFIVDEIGKFNPTGLLESALPSFRNAYGFRLVPILTGCVCKGTKVWNNKGESVNIEDLVHSEGILGFDQEKGKVSKEIITYWQPPRQKPCYRIETSYGRILECSDDHPILIKEGRNNVFRETKDLKVGDYVCALKGFTEDLFETTSRDEVVSKIVDAFEEQDGVYRKYNKLFIRLYSKSREYLENIRDLLTRLAIASKIFKFKGRYVLGISKMEDILRFSNEISLRTESKNEILKTFSEKNSSRIVLNEKGYYYEKVSSITSIGNKDVYNLTAGTTNTYIANGIITHNTGGNAKLSAGARTILENPEANSMLPMDWNLLDKLTDLRYWNWEKEKKSKFCTFVPGQMSYRVEVPKIEKRLGDVLGIKSKKLNQIPIMCTDWQKATEWIENEKAIQPDENKRNKVRMYYPMSITDCFLTDSINPFPVAKIIERIAHLKAIPKHRLVDIEPASDGSGLRFTMVDRPLAERAYRGIPVDAPFQLFGDIEDGRIPSNKMASGLDDYKLDQSKTTSLGAFYVVQRRNVDINTPIEKIVLSLATRPEVQTTFHQKVESAISRCNVLCNMESIDVAFMSFLRNTDKELDKYLLKAINPATELTNKKGGSNRGQSKWGTYPTEGNIRYSFQQVVNYTWEMVTVGIDTDGRAVQKQGIDFIDDIQLLEEMLDYVEGGNHDRIVAFGLALTMCKHLDNKKIIVENVQKELVDFNMNNKPKRKEPMKFQNFSNRRFNNFRVTKK